MSLLGRNKYDEEPDDEEDTFGVDEEDKRKYVLLDPEDYPDDPEDPRDISFGDMPARFKHTYEDDEDDDTEKSK